MVVFFSRWRRVLLERSGGDRRIPVLSEEATGVLELAVEDVQEIMDTMVDEMRDVVR